MVTTIGFSPTGTSNFAGTFGVGSEGYYQGVALDDPAVRYALSGGVLATSETLPMWGGVAISELVPTPPRDAMGPTIQRATSIANMTGFSVMNQAHHALTSTASQCPLIVSGQSVHFYRFGCGARIPVKMDPVLVNEAGGLINQPLAWDFVNQQLVSYAATYAANVFTAMTSGSPATDSTGVSYVTVTGTTTTAHGLVPGNSVTISGVTPAGYNGTYTLQQGTTGSTIVYKVPSTSALAAVTTQGTIVAGGGGTALNARVLAINTTNSKVVNYNATSNTASWIGTGAVAVILI